MVIDGIVGVGGSTAITIFTAIRIITTTNSPDPPTNHIAEGERLVGGRQASEGRLVIVEREGSHAMVVGEEDLIALMK